MVNCVGEETKVELVIYWLPMERVDLNFKFLAFSSTFLFFIPLPRCWYKNCISSLAIIILTLLAVEDTVECIQGYSVEILSVPLTL